MYYVCMMYDVLDSAVSAACTTQVTSNDGVTKEEQH